MLGHVVCYLSGIGILWLFYTELQPILLNNFHMRDLVGLWSVMHEAVGHVI